MAIVFHNEEYKVDLIHYKSEKLSEERRSQGIEVDDIPAQPESKIGKSHHLYINPETKEMWYEEVERELTDAEKLQVQESEVNQLKTDRINTMKALVELHSEILTLKGES